MKELLKNVFYIGAGAAFLTKEKIEELKGELIDKGKMTQDEGKQFVDELARKSKTAADQLEERIQKVVTDQLKKMNVAGRDDIDELRARIEELKAVLDKNQTST